MRQLDMGKLVYTVDINAPKQKVWDVMLDDKTYREWTGAFHEGSYYEGSWDEGSPIRFLAMDEGKLGGMLSKIVKNVPYEYISIEHLGEVVDGQDDTMSEDAQQWIGSHENYTFKEKDGVTTLLVELDGEGVTDEMTEMFEQMWPPALSKLKEIAEA
jgi:uncharacterized protein YndB with AHSA1/START domain